MSPNHITFPQLLQAAGYSTALFGKWHLAGSSASGWSGIRPRQAGFDFFKGHFDSQLPDYWSYDVHIQDDTTFGTDYSTVSAANVEARSLPGITATTYAPVVKGANTIDWIQARHAEDPEKPWFVWLAFNTSHVTTQYPYMVVPDAETLDTASYDEMVDCGGTFGTKTVGGCTGPQLMRAMSNSMDTVIGKVLDVVDKLGPNTYVIFIGDNGTPMFGGYKNQIDNMYITKTGRGKGTPYESGCRVPMAIRGPNIAAGQQKGTFVHLADLSATILTLAGLEPPETNKDNNNNTVDSDSVSLSPILFGDESASRDPNEGYLLTETNPGIKRVGARNATYKVICLNNTSSSNCTLYNLITDPLEEYPLSKPGSCTNYTTNYTTADSEWHYCRLVEVMNADSIF
jgi:arylsulfatase A-like enzyme